ncbi:RTA1 like protein-domain-containing protein [Lipomyces kononenkoae]|uniref:RTA1 like protein-domain-containing protein n=1 Tax=Lipomyces kononenkoae TaxID=34357 RepID=A0ACC3T1F7_LIPKO
MSSNNSQTNFYQYIPLEAPNLAALVLFVVAWATHAVLTAYHKRIWFSSCMLIATGLEAGGYIARYLSSSNPYNYNNYIVQTVLLIFAPAFFMAGVYYLLGEITVIWGTEYARFRPWTYTKIFVTLDVLSIVIQGIGGGVASSNLNSNSSTQTGTDIMIGGLAFQVCATLLFMISCLDYYLRVRKAHRVAALSLTTTALELTLETGEQRAMPGDAPGEYATIRHAKKTKVFLAAVTAAVILVFVRSVYRVVELSVGWSGYLMTTEVYFLVLDSLMIVLATWIMCIFHPGFYLGKVNIRAEQTLSLSSDTEESNVVVGGEVQEKKRFGIF